MSDLELENRRLLAQVDYLSGDEHIRREAEPWRQVTPGQRLAATLRLCTLAARFRSRWSAEVRQRADEPHPLPAESAALLARMRARSRDA